MRGVAPYVGHGEKEGGGNKARYLHAVLVPVAENGHGAVVALVEGVHGGEEVGGEVLRTGLSIEGGLQVASAVVGLPPQEICSALVPNTPGGPVKPCSQLWYVVIHHLLSTLRIRIVLPTLFL